LCTRTHAASMEAIGAKTLPSRGGRRERAGRSKGGIVCKFRSIPGATDEEQREGNNEMGCTDEDNERIGSPVCGSMLSGRHPVVDANKGTWEPKLVAALWSATRGACAGQGLQLPA
jgi:hypothetical protein